MRFCSDTDLLHWEPNLFRDAVFASQLLLSGTGDLDGTELTAAGASFSAAHVSAGQVVVLSGAINGSYPIVSVDGETQLTLSVMYDGLFPPSGEGVPSPVGTAVGLGFAIRTFDPQRRVVSDLLRHLAGVGPGTALPAASIVNADSLRRPCVLGTLQMIYNALAAAATEPGPVTVRADLYERLYRRALAQARAEIDENGDGRADRVRRLRVVELVRG